MNLYRCEPELKVFDDFPYFEPSTLVDGITILEYKVRKETDRGYWISRHYSNDFDFHDDSIPPNQKNCRWISKLGNKRWAYPTKELALHALKYRKQKQVEILKHQLQVANETLVILEKEG